MVETKNRSLRVFLCHASQDKPAVRKLYKRLAEEAWIDPWLDEEELLPGQDWDLEIRKALREADAIIVCLSKESVAKEGYVQKEFKRALSLAEEKPEGTIYIIPLRLDDCRPPMSLENYQWLNYFERGAHGKLIQTLRLRHAELQAKDKNLTPITPTAEAKKPAKRKKKAAPKGGVTQTPVSGEGAQIATGEQGRNIPTQTQFIDLVENHNNSRTRIEEIIINTARAAPGLTPQEYLQDLVERTNWPEDRKVKFSGTWKGNLPFDARQLVKFALSQKENPSHPEYTMIGGVLEALIPDVGGEAQKELSKIIQDYGLIKDKEIIKKIQALVNGG